jgi:hypothetical protein
MRFLHLLLCGFLFLYAPFLYCQEMLGFSNSNYAGTNGVIMNPASMSHSRLRWDINLITLDFFAQNDYAYIPRKAFGINYFANPGLNIRDLSIDTYKSAYVNFFMEAPSAMINRGKNSFGINFRLRNNAFMQGFTFTPSKKLSFTDAEFHFDGMSWAEIGLSYSRVIKSNSKNSLAAGITIKGLFGLAAVYTTNDVGFYTSAIKATTDRQFGRAKPDTSHFLLGTGEGIDIGISYERRIDPKKFVYYYQRNGLEFYRYKVGVSLLDIGSIGFNYNSKLYGFGSDSLLFTIVFGNPENQVIGNKFRIITPAALCLHADYNVAGPFYVNCTYYNGLHIPPDPPILRPSQIAFTLRYETKNFEVTVPYSIYGNNLHRLGLAFRFYNVIIGTDKLGTFIGTENITGFDFYLAVKIFSLKQLKSQKAYTCKKRFNKKE